MPKIITALLVIGAAALLLMLPMTLHGQEDLCPALVERALEEVAQACTDLERNSACYGYNRVDATFYETQGVDFFSTPADRAALGDIESIQTAALNVEQSEWGIALLKIQANLPDTLPGQAVTFVLLGDAQIEAAGGPQQSAGVTPIRVTALDYLNIRSRPSERSNVVTSVGPGTILVADGIDSEGDWLRIVHEGTPGWINRFYAQTEGDLGSLPRVDSTATGAMQAFYLRTGLSGTSCEQAPPSMLVVQSPRHIAIDLNVNGVDIRVGSTVALRANPERGMTLGVLDGRAQVGGVVVPTGFTVGFELDTQGRVISPPFGLRPFNAAELAEYATLEQLPTPIMNYAVEPPTAEDIAAFIAALETLEPTMPPPPPTPIAVPGGGDSGTTPVIETPAPAEPPPDGNPTPEVTPPVDPPELVRLQLTALCSPDPDSFRVWRVRNSNPFDVPFTWDIAGSGQSGSGIAAASGDSVFQTSTERDGGGSPTANTLRLFVDGQQQDVKASNPARCS